MQEKDGKPHGEGRVAYLNTRVVMTVSPSGAKSGTPIMGGEYEGAWSFGERSGKGIMRFRKGEFKVCVVYNLLATVSLVSQRPFFSCVVVRRGLGGRPV